VGACKFDSLKGKRLGIVRNLVDLSDDDTAALIIPMFNAALHWTLVRNTITPYIQPKTELVDIVAKRKASSQSAHASRNARLEFDRSPSRAFEVSVSSTFC
jgi:hypothetical protein